MLNIRNVRRLNSRPGSYTLLRGRTTSAECRDDGYARTGQVDYEVGVRVAEAKVSPIRTAWHEAVMWLC